MDKHTQQGNIGLSSRAFNAAAIVGTVAAIGLTLFAANSDNDLAKAMFDSQHHVTGKNLTVLSR